MSADLYSLPRILSFFFLSFFIRQLPSELAERNSTKTGHMLGNECDLKMRVRNLGYPVPYKSGGQNHLFRRLCSLTASLMACIFGTKHDTGLHKRASALQTIQETTWTLVDKRLQIGGEFSPTLCKFCIPFHCQASQSEVRKRNWTKLCQTVADKSR